MKQYGTQIDKLDEIVWLSILYDFYGELLSPHKKQVFEDYILNDLSLSEIADDLKISRQGVHDIVKRCSQELKDFDQKLGLVSKFQKVKDKVEQVKDILFESEKSGDFSRIYEIDAIADDILKEL